MADRQGGARPTLLGRLQERSPNSSQAMGFLALVVSGSILLLLSGLTLTGLVMGLVLFAPLLLITSPIWVPMAIAVFLGAVAVLSACSFGAAAVAAATWVYRYLTGRNPMGAGRVDYARSQIADTASHVKGYAREYGGYLQSSRAKDAAPGA